MDSSEQMSRQRPAMSLVVIGKELGLVGRHVDAGGAFALAAFARQAQVQSVMDGAVGGVAVEKIAGQGFEQEMRPAARGMGFLARRHVRRAHRAAFVVAALADPDTSKGGAGEAIVGAEIEMGCDRPRYADGAQMRVEIIGGDDDAGIHPAIGIENPLELAEGLDQSGAKYFGKQLRARAAVAMLA